MGLSAGLLSLGLSLTLGAHGLVAAEPPYGDARDEDPPAASYRQDAALGTLFALVPGYGMGHFVVGDRAGGIKFMVLDGATTMIWALGPAAASVLAGGMPDEATRPGFWIFLGGILAWGVVKIWQVVDVGRAAEAPAYAPGSLSISLGPAGATLGVRAFRF